jgi:hypothetical protein
MKVSDTYIEHITDYAGERVYETGKGRSQEASENMPLPGTTVLNTKRLSSLATERHGSALCVTTYFPVPDRYLVTTLKDALIKSKTNRELHELTRIISIYSCVFADKFDLISVALKTKITIGLQPPADELWPGQFAAPG